jgi:hypothetical protein
MVTHISNYSNAAASKKKQKSNGQSGSRLMLKSKHQNPNMPP